MSGHGHRARRRRLLAACASDTEPFACRRNVRFAEEAVDVADRNARQTDRRRRRLDLRLRELEAA